MKEAEGDMNIHTPTTTQAPELQRVVSFVSQLDCPDGEDPEGWPARRDHALVRMRSEATRANWPAFILAVPKHGRLRVWELMRNTALPIGAVRQALAQAWRCERCNEESLSQARLVRLFRSVGYLSEGGQPRPSEPVLLFRGATPCESAGMSWTPDANVACMFAWLHFQEELMIVAAERAASRIEELGGLFGALIEAASGAPSMPLERRPRVYGAFIEPSRMLAHFNGAEGLKTEEYVIDPSGLRIWEVDGASDPIRFGEQEYAARTRELAPTW